MSTDAGRLVIRLDGAIVRTVPLAQPVLTIGRTPDNDLALPNSVVSRRHAELRLGATGPILTDLGSANGTFVAETRLLPQQPLPLNDGETFAIGPYLLTYILAADRPADTLFPPEPAGVALREVVPRDAAPRVPDRPLGAATAPLAHQPHRTPPVSSGASSYLRDLPGIFQDSDFLGRFLGIFEAIWEPLEQRQDQLAMYIDPRTCPVSFLPWLAGWLSLPINPRWPEARVRHLLTEAMDLNRWRGTRYGLARLIEIHTGVAPRITDAAEPFVFRVSLTVPPDVEVDRGLLEDLILAQKPAHTSYVLELRP